MDVNSWRLSTGELLEVGKIYYLTRKASDCGVGIEGAPVKIVVLRLEGHHISVGIHSLDNNFVGFHTLDDILEDNKGYWLNEKNTPEYLTFDPINYVVNKDVIFKDRNLNGMTCTILGCISETEVMVEFEECIGGVSGDGQGKKGHCLPISVNSLTEVEKSKVNKAVKGVVKSKT